MPEEKVIYVALRAQFLQQLNHVIAAILLATSGFAALQHGRHAGWGVLELAVAVVLLALFVRSRLHAGHGPQEHVADHIGWLEIASGLVVAVEKTSLLRESPHHVSFVILSYVPAVILIGLGLFESHFRRRFFIRAGDEELSWRFARWRHGNVEWKEIVEASVTPRSVTFAMNGGIERKIPTWRVLQTKAVNTWIVQRLNEREIAVHADAMEEAPEVAEPAAERDAPTA